MSKAEFLKILEDRLSMLEMQERKDILSEYTMHIEMKVKGGMSEREAIDDFGDIDSLIGEILAAYHIDPSYKKTDRKNPAGEIGKKAGNVITKSKESWSHFMEQKKEKQEQVMEKKKKEDKEKPSRWKNKTVLWDKERGDRETVSVFLKKMWNTLKWIIVFCIKMMLVLILIPAVIVELLSLFGLGALLILLMQGYPLIGVTLGMLGCVLVFGAYCLLVLTFIIEKKNRNRKEEEA